MHLIAVFDAGAARPPAEMMVVTAEADADTPAQAAAAVECAAAAALDALLAAGGEEKNNNVGVRLAPATGFAARGAPHAVAHEEGARRAALFYGKAPPPTWPAATDGGGEEEMEEETTPAQRVLSLVGQLSDLLPEDAVDAALASLQALAEDAGGEGDENEDEGFAIVAFDAETGALLVARDAAGAAPLYWGTTPEGLLMVGADPEDMSACYPSAAPFPAGALFSSRVASAGSAEEPGEGGYVLVGDGGAATPGRLASFVPRRTMTAARPPAGPSAFRAVRAVPRVDEAGVLCGAVFRVASEGELGGGNGGMGRVGRV